MQVFRSSRRLALLVSVSLLPLFSTASFSQTKPQSFADYFVGRPAPDFHLKDLDGHDLQLSSFKGNIVVLDFWATWCGPCRAEIPMIESLSKQFASKGVVFVGIDSEETAETVRSFVTKNKLTYRIALTTQNDSVIAAYAAVALPTVVVVDRDGIVAEYRVGERSDIQDILHADLHHVLSSKYVPPQPKSVPAPNLPRSPALSASGAPAPGPDPNWKPQTADEFLARGFALLNIHHNAAAEADAEQALNLRPDSYMAIFLRGRANYELKDYAAAVEDFNTVVQAKPDWAPAYQFRGLSYSHMGQHERALPDYQKVLELKPYMAGGYNDLGSAYRELNQFDKAKINLDRAIDLEPNYVRARENRAILYAKQNDRTNALAELTTILAISPNDRWAYQAKEAAEQGRQLPVGTQFSSAPDSVRPDVLPRVLSKIEPEYTDEARRAGVNATILCSATVNANGRAEDIRVTRGAGFGLDENAIRALETWRFEPAKKDGKPVPQPARLEMTFRLSLSGHENQTVSLAFNLPSDASRPVLMEGKVPDNPKNSSDAELEIAFAVDANGRTHDESVVRTSSTDWAHASISRISNWRFRPAALNGQPIEAKGIFRLLVKAPGSTRLANQQEPDPNWQPRTADEFLARGWARLRIHQFAQAEADAEQAAKLSSNPALPLYLRGRAAYDAKEYSDALDAFDKVIQQRPDWPEAYRHRGLSYSHSGQYQRAVADYQKAIELDPNFASAYNDLGSAYMELGQLDLAAHNLEKAIELEPNLISAHENRARLFERKGDLNSEQKELAIILGLSPNNEWAKNNSEAAHQQSK